MFYLHYSTYLKNIHDVDNPQIILVVHAFTPYLDPLFPLLSLTLDENVQHCSHRIDC